MDGADTPKPLEPLAACEEEVDITVGRGWVGHEIADHLHISWLSRGVRGGGEQRAVMLRMSRKDEIRALLAARTSRARGLMCRLPAVVIVTHADG